MILQLRTQKPGRDLLCLHRAGKRPFSPNGLSLRPVKRSSQLSQMTIACPGPASAAQNRATYWVEHGKYAVSNEPAVLEEILGRLAGKRLPPQLSRFPGLQRSPFCSQFGTGEFFLRVPELEESYSRRRGRWLRMQPVLRPPARCHSFGLRRVLMEALRRVYKLSRLEILVRFLFDIWDRACNARGIKLVLPTLFLLRYAN